ncbi:MAG: iron-containing alcohol dehydrogenase, partial [Spirochaetaceae bacterium]|nr:iron-containing alcohol dehydrogenase [Spirochaetaceae bacterium]
MYRRKEEENHMSAFLQLPPRVHLGAGSLEETGTAIKRLEARRVLICTDSSLRKLGMTKALEDCIAKTGVDIEITDQVMAEPSIEDVEKTLASVPGGNIDLLIGLGGGSVMDTAKLISVLLGAPYTIQDILKNSAPARKQVPTLMIPTTCGTG